MATSLRVNTVCEEEDLDKTSSFSNFIQKQLIYSLLLRPGQLSRVIVHHQIFSDSYWRKQMTSLQSMCTRDGLVFSCDSGPCNQQ